MVLDISDSALYSNFQPPDDQESPQLFSENKNFCTSIGFRIRKLRFPTKRGIAFIYYKLDNILVEKRFTRWHACECAGCTFKAAAHRRSVIWKSLNRGLVIETNICTRTLVEASMAGEQLISISQTLRSESITRSYLSLYWQTNHFSNGFEELRRIPEKLEGIFSRLNGVLS